MTKIAICDDEELIRIQLYNIIYNYLERRNIKAEILIYSSGSELLENIKSHDISCLFMDIDFNDDLDGIETTKRLREFQNTIMIIFITSYSEYTQKALSLHAFDYITKPYKNIEIYNVLDDLFLWLKETNRDDIIRVQFKTINGLVSLNLDDIIYFEYKNRRIDIITKTTRYHMYGKIRDVFNRVKDYGFAVPHISYIINLNEIKALIKSKYIVVMINEYEIPISQLKLKEFCNTYLNYLKRINGEN